MVFMRLRNRGTDYLCISFPFAPVWRENCLPDLLTYRANDFLLQLCQINFELLNTLEVSSGILERGNMERKTSKIDSNTYHTKLSHFINFISTCLYLVGYMTCHRHFVNDYGEMSIAPSIDIVNYYFVFSILLKMMSIFWLVLVLKTTTNDNHTLCLLYVQALSYNIISLNSILPLCTIIILIQDLKEGRQREVK